MKTFKSIIMLALICITNLVSGQDTIYVSHNKTTAIEFPARIANPINAGHHLIAAIKGDNVLTVKAAKGFLPSQISITMEDGKNYHFPVDFSYGRAGRFYRLASNQETETPDASSKAPEEEISSKLAAGRVRNVVSSDRKSRVKAELGQISVLGNTLFYKLKIENHSSINYDLDFVRFYVRDLKTAKRTVTQEREIHPTQAIGVSQNTITAGGSGLYVFGFDKFPLAKGQALFTEIYEKNGARNLYLKVTARENVSAQLIKE
ncbi:DUF4138 domain-containing protein [Arcticibacter sp. MXS-1]|uniref:DUF4138 domain-containing protein n=1 Tax=Arcticibacter sp. MXS-1 TaxID=3341726 RepID=UPI0035A97D33